MIAWIYLDKKSAAVAALKDYPTMEFIIQGHDDTEKELRECMTSVPSTSSIPVGTARNSNPHAGEARLTAQIDEIDVLKERYRRALEYMDWFRPAWQQLTDDEQYVLDVFYGTHEPQAGAVSSICHKFHIERSSAYNMKNRALARLALLLYGK